ncbi:MAG: LPS export ABC transporter periplasmic protein LptC [Muribaculaceae bacterium]|nr:LPS export ABC transporter periplasmic protein LptC [Muribaculaceae bacterium]
MFFILMSAYIAGCKEEQKLDVAHRLDASKMPTMSTRNISTLISDSGITQYKIVAPLWNIYDEAQEPYWSFPEGIYLQKFDARYNVIATVAADSAKFYKNERLWRLDGEVELTKVPKDLFISPRLFWDQRKQKLYSDTFIHIENATHVLEGTGFESDESLTQYRILKPNGIFPINKVR